MSTRILIFLSSWNILFLLRARWLNDTREQHLSEHLYGTSLNSGNKHYPILMHINWNKPFNSLSLTFSLPMTGFPDA